MSELAEDLRRFKDGDREAFEHLYRAQSQRLLTIALRVLGDRALAEDAVQETFLRIVEERPPFARRGRRSAGWVA
jgi:RNA polymerase sigma-70 factor (ECF subfamily)